MSIIFSIDWWKNLINERCYTEDKEVMAAKLALYSSFYVVKIQG